MSSKSTAAIGSSANSISTTFQSIRLIVAASIALLCFGHAAIGAVLYQDRFSNGINSDWSIKHQDASFYSVSTNGLLFRCCAGSYYGPQTSYKNLFLITNPAVQDFLFTAKLRWVQPPTANYGQFTLVAYDDDDNYAQVDYTYGDASMWIEEYGEVSGSLLDGYDPGYAQRLGTNEFWLQMKKQGTFYSTWFSTNGTVFNSVNFLINYGNGHPSRLGFLGMQDPTQSATVLVDSITVEDIAVTDSLLTKGLVAYYPFNGNANDASGNGNNAVVYGAILTTDRFDSPGSAYYFDGTNSYIDIPQSATLNGLVTNFTLSAWIWQNGVVNGGYRIIDKCPAGTGNGWTFDTINCAGCPTTIWRLRLQANANNPDNVYGSTDYSLRQWHHVVASVSGTNGTVYLDGHLNGSGGVGNIPVNALDVFIGSGHPSADPGHAWFNGIIDDVRIYNRSLSSSEIRELYAYEGAPVVSLKKAVKPSFNNLFPGTTYQLQVSPDMNNWTNNGSSFTPTNTVMDYPEYFDVDDWSELFFRLQVAP